MLKVIQGILETPIDVDDFLVKCQSCETQSWAEIIVVSRYYHIYWVPIFPMEKTANIICKKCGLKRYGIAFDPLLISNYEEIKRGFKHPLFTYLGLSIALLFVLVIILSKTFK